MLSCLASLALVGHVAAACSAGFTVYTNDCKIFQTAVASGSGKHCLKSATCSGMRFVIAKGVSAEVDSVTLQNNDVSSGSWDASSGCNNRGALVYVNSGASFINGKGK